MHLRTILLFISSSFLLLFPLHAQTMLSGNIGGVTFTPSGNPYIVNDNITIQEGKTTTIKAGCVFLFRPFCGLVVNGSLIVEGTLQSPVVFTSAFDREYAPNAEQSANPFDWNGILISPQAGNVSFSNIVLEYSVYGIKSQKDALLLNNATFSNNGQFHFTIGEKIQQVTEGKPYSYGKTTKKSKRSDSTVITQPTPAWDTTKPVSDRGREEKGSFRKAAPVVLAATGLVCGIGTIISLKIMGDAHSAHAFEADQDKRNGLELKYRVAMTSGIILGGITAVCLPTSIVLLIKDHMSQPKPVKVSVSPDIGRELGIRMSVTF